MANEMNMDLDTILRTEATHLFRESIGAGIGTAATKANPAAAAKSLAVPICFAEVTYFTGANAAACWSAHVLMAHPPIKVPIWASTIPGIGTPWVLMIKWISARRPFPGRNPPGINTSIPSGRRPDSR